MAELVRSVLRDPVSVSVGTPNAGAAAIEQRLVFVGREEGKLLAFRQLVQQGLRPPVLVFVQSKERAKELHHELAFDGINVDVIHADRSPEQRDAVIKNFRLGKVQMPQHSPPTNCVLDLLAFPFENFPLCSQKHTGFLKA